MRPPRQWIVGCIGEPGLETLALPPPVDGGAGDAQPPPDAVWPPGERPACSADGCFLQLTGLAGAAQGTAGAVKERVLSAFAEPPHPLGDGRAGDAEQAGHFRPGASHPLPVRPIRRESRGSSVRYDVP